MDDNKQKCYSSLEDNPYNSKEFDDYLNSLSDDEAKKWWEEELADSQLLAESAI